MRNKNVQDGFKFNFNPSILKTPRIFIRSAESTLENTSLEAFAGDIKINLGVFMSTSDSPNLKQDPRFKKAKIVISEQCTGFAIDDFKIAGLAFPSVNKQGVVLVGIYAWLTDNHMSKVEANQSMLVMRSAEHEIRRLVSEAYKTRFHILSEE
jgi:hypothetical protein